LVVVAVYVFAFVVSLDANLGVQINLFSALVALKARTFRATPAVIDWNTVHEQAVAAAKRC
jgi:hypothetical protein